jgi:hypothetical protein
MWQLVQVKAGIGALFPAAIHCEASCEGKLDDARLSPTASNPNRGAPNTTRYFGNFVLNLFMFVLPLLAKL